MKQVMRSVVLISTLSAVGCGTVVNQHEPGSYFNYHGAYRPHRVYGGVRVCADALASPYLTLLSGEQPDILVTHTHHSSEGGKEVVTDLTSYGQKAFTLTGYTLLWTLNTPLSLIADTIFLPLDAWAQFKRLTTPASSKADTESAAPPPDEMR